MARKFLAPRARPGNGHGYLSEPLRPLEGTEYHVDPPEAVERVAGALRMCDEPECCSEDVVSYAESAFTADTLRHAAEVEVAQEDRKRLEMEQRIVNAERRARLQHMNLSGEFFLIRKMLDRAQAGGRKEPEGAVRRLEDAEAVLDGQPLKRLEELRRRAA